jgi:hypothetical protein
MFFHHSKSPPPLVLFPARQLAPGGRQHISGQQKLEETYNLQLA